MAHSNSWLIRRDVNNLTIIVSAHAIPKMAAWGLTCKVNGQLVDHRQADDPVADGINMINAAIIDNETGEAVVVDIAAVREMSKPVAEPEVQAANTKRIVA